MAVPNTPNADLEQALFKANLKEKKLRRRAMMAALVPFLAGLAWLIYSFMELTTLQTHADAVESHEAETVQREQDAQKRVTEIETKLAASEARVQTIQQQQKAATQAADEVRQRLVKVRDEIGGLGALLTDLNAVKMKASKLMNSEDVESQITKIRSGFSSSLARVEQEIDKALPAEEQKARIYIFIADDSQAAMAKQLAPVLEAAGFDVAGVAKNPAHKTEATEIRYFHDPEDRQEATKIQDLLIKQTGQSDCKTIRTSDPDNASGSRKFQIWLGKTPAAVPR